MGAGATGSQEPSNDAGEGHGHLCPGAKLQVKDIQGQIRLPGCFTAGAVPSSPADDSKNQTALYCLCTSHMSLTCVFIFHLIPKRVSLPVCPAHVGLVYSLREMLCIHVPCDSPYYGDERCAQSLWPRESEDTKQSPGHEPQMLCSCVCLPPV